MRGTGEWHNTMQEEKNRTTPGQKMEKKKRRRRKSAVTAKPVEAAVPQRENAAGEEPTEAAVAEPSVPQTTATETAEAAHATEATPLQGQTTIQPETPEVAESAQEAETVSDGQTAEPSEEQKGEEAQAAPEEPTAAAEEQPEEPDVPAAEAEKAEPEETAPATGEEPQQEAPAPTETQEPEPTGQTTSEDVTPAEEQAAPAEAAGESDGTPEAAEEPTPAQEAQPGETPEPAAETIDNTPEEPSDGKPAQDAEETSDGNALEETTETPAAQTDAEESSEEEKLSEEEEKRISDLTRTVQLSVEQIMARVSEEESADEQTAEDTAESPAELESETMEETPATLQDTLRSGLSGMAKWFLLVVFFVLVIAGCGVAWLYRSATPDMLPQITVTFAGQTLEPTAYKWKVPVIGNIFKRTYADTYSSTPVELSEAIDQVSPDFVITPSDYRTELTVTDGQDNAVFEGDVDTFSSFQFTSNGTYTAKLVVHSDASSVPGYTTVTGSETWYFTFSVGVRPSVRLSGTSVNQGSAVAVRVGDTLDGSKPTLQTELENAGFFKASSGWVCYLPIPWNEPAGTRTLVVTAGGYTEQLELNIKAVSWEYKDYYSESQRVSPYIGQNDIPAELQKLLTQSEETIAWSNGNFVQPFLNTLDVELPFGATEYVGRSYSQRSTNSGAGGRTVTNLVLNTTSGELLIAPASGTVLLAKDLGGDFGYTLVIDHGAGIKSIFYNLQKISVKAGAAVKQGQTLATCNRTTVAEMRIGTVPVDPLQIWRGQCDAIKYY